MDPNFTEVSPQKQVSKKVQKGIDFDALSHNELISFMAEHNGDNAAWREFLNRFQKFIAAVIIKECQRIDYPPGIERVEDLLHSVYLRLLVNDGKALKNYRGKYENSIIPYLKFIAQNVVRSDKISSSKGNLKSIDDENLINTISVPAAGGEMVVKEAFKYALQIVEKRRRYGARDVLIYRHAVIEGLNVKEVSKLPECKEMSPKRVANIVSEVKAEVKDIMVEEGF